MNLNPKILAKIINGRPYKLKSKVIKGFSIDSRTIKEGEVFIAIKGEKFDGHQFVEEAQKKSKTFAICEKPVKKDIILVKDTKEALKRIAKYLRELKRTRFIAITGSNGKTTTKEMVYQILSTHYDVTKSIKSYNNLFGVALTIFNLKDEEICVCELGMNHRGEIDELARIVQPETGIVLNVAPAHIGFFKNIDEIAEAKKELIRYPQKLILNADDEKIKDWKTEKETIWFGIKSGDVRARNIEVSENGTDFICEGVDFHLNFIGIHHVYNALSAICAGRLYGIGMHTMSDALRKVNPSEGRGKVFEKRGIKIYDSSYNANPKSMECELEAFSFLSGKRKIAVLGDMLELGEKARDFHIEIGRKLEKYGINYLIAYGDLAKYYLEDVKIPSYYFSSKEELTQFLHKFVEEGDAVFFKASRKIGLDEVINEVF